MENELLGELELNRIYQMDCLEGMKLLPSNSVSLICIDPPYNIGKDVWDKWDSEEEYIHFMGNVYKECERILKDTGSFYFFHSDFLQIAELQSWIRKNTNFVFKRFIVWDKFNGTKWSQLNANVHQDYNRNYPQQAEYCLFYTLQDENFKQRIGTGLKKLLPEIMHPIQSYFRNALTESGLTYTELAEKFQISNTAVKHWFDDKNNPRLPTKDKYEELQKIMNLPVSYNQLKQQYDELKHNYKQRIADEQTKSWQNYLETRYTFNNQSLPSVWQHEPVYQNGHLTPKPIGILENILKTSSNENDIVLDCFMGSGSTAVACINTKRKFIGFEKESKYIEISSQRIENTYDMNKII